MQPDILAACAATDVADPVFERDVLAGLTAPQKRLPSKYFYDAHGSELFEQICEQPEYYLTRVELQIMQAHAADMASALGPQVRLVEFGSGAGIKTRLLLAALEQPIAYVPVEISDAALEASTALLRNEFPQVVIQPVSADFTRPLDLPAPPRPPGRTALYFPGSTLGNFETADALRLLQQMHRLVGANGSILLGLDLKKPVAELEAAYNDAAGVTAEFTLNLLTRINRELCGDFALDGFRHRAVYNAEAGRIETSIVSLEDQQASVAGQRIHFDRHEAIHVEISCKYSEADLQHLAARAGLEVSRTWTDPGRKFAVFLLSPVSITSCKP